MDRQQSLSVDDRLGQRMSPISPNSSQASSGHSYGRQLSVQELFAGVKHLAFESPFIYEKNYLNISYGKSPQNVHKLIINGVVVLMLKQIFSCWAIFHSKKNQNLVFKSLKFLSLTKY